MQAATENGQDEAQVDKGPKRKRRAWEEDSDEGPDSEDEREKQRQEDQRQKEEFEQRLRDRDDAKTKKLMEAKLSKEEIEVSNGPTWQCIWQFMSGCFVALHVLVGRLSSHCGKAASKTGTFGGICLCFEDARGINCSVECDRQSCARMHCTKCEATCITPMVHIWFQVYSVSAGYGAEKGA